MAAILSDHTDLTVGCLAPGITTPADSNTDMLHTDNHSRVMKSKKSRGKRKKNYDEYNIIQNGGGTLANAVFHYDDVSGSIILPVTAMIQLHVSNTHII